MLKYLRNLVKISAVSGNEGRICEYIASEMRGFFDSIDTDAMGNLICRKKGGEKKLMLCAHTDEIGALVTYIGEDGYLRCAPVGGVNFSAAAYSAVELENGRSGVIVPEENVKAEDYKADNFVVDIGAKTRGEASRLVHVGDTLAFKKSVTKLCGTRLTGHPLDNRIGCALLMKAAESSERFANDTFFVFSSQEEVGLRGAKCAAFAVAPDYGVCVDVTTAGDTKGAKWSDIRLGGGAAIKIKDKSAICDVSLVEMLKKTARENKIPWQAEIITSGGTDTASMQLAGAGCRAGCVSVPARYIHTDAECIDMRDAEAALRLVSAFCEVRL